MRHHAPRVLVLLVAACSLLLVFAAPSMARTHRDRNHDGLPDRWERSHHLSLKVNQARRDQDHDGLRNRAEFVAGTNPRDADTDNDGIDDAAEDAGKVVSFDAASGQLSIMLFNGDVVTGTVTADTEIECGDREEDHGGGDRPNDVACDATSLTAGMVVREAELSATPQGLVFDKVEVVPAAPTQ